ncbi:unnamed protein product [Phytomonas sp. Hart1]|nr:unnamed protein product [Phytomonas sp. Hart1]|eukprot:CCW68153.1 unnamed protein product [Phytomonas sp. isolate Hart1]
MNSDALNLKGNNFTFTSSANKDATNNDLTRQGQNERDDCPLEYVRNSNNSFQGRCKSLDKDENKGYWKQKRQEKRAKKSNLSASRKAEQKTKWELLTEDEKNKCRASAIKMHEERRHANELFMVATRQRLVDPELPVLVFDLSFAWCMSFAETTSTISQLKFSYSTLRRAGFPFRPVFSSLIGKEKQNTEHDASAQAELLQASLINFEGFKRFPPTVAVDQHWSELFHKEKVVFLSADADEILEDIHSGHIYVIGAFVDHNRYKGLSRTCAEAHGVRVARLPVKESIDLCNRSVVLTINHLVEVLRSYVQPEEGCARDWARALDAVLPVRRIQQEALGSRKRRRQQQQNSIAFKGYEGHADFKGVNFDPTL